MIVFVLAFLLLFSECMFYNREADRWYYVKSTRKIAVRQVVEFILRRGSIDSRHVSEHTPQEGSRLQRMLQKEAGSLYQKEVSLKIEVPLNCHNYGVEGRADGIFVKETGQVV
ncbi:ATP-dependent helicase, partial [Enterococcus faecalis]